jgi:hypothetical protein
MIPEAPYLPANDTSKVGNAEKLNNHVPVFIEWGTLLLPVYSFDARPSVGQQLSTSDRPEGI